MHLIHFEGLPLLCRLQVDGQGGHAQHRPFDSEQALLERAIFRPYNHTTRERQIPIEPSVPETAAIALDINLSSFRWWAVVWMVGRPRGPSGRAGALRIRSAGTKHTLCCKITCVHPAALPSRIDLGLTLRLGESVCAPIILKPSPGW